MNNNNDYCVQKRNLQVSKEDETKMSKLKLAKVSAFRKSIRGQPRPQGLSFPSLWASGVL